MKGTGWRACAWAWARERMAPERFTLMQGKAALDILPIWAIFFVTLVLVLIAVEAGYKLGRTRRTRSEQAGDEPGGMMVEASLGVLALLLAFTFGLAVARFDTRRHLVIDEANAIGTTWLRAAMIPEGGDEVRALLRQYADARLQAGNPDQLQEAIRRSEELQNQLWARAVPLAREHPNSIIVGLFVQSLNEVIDLHGKRIGVGVRGRLPGIIWLALYAVAVLALGVLGYNAGLSGVRRPLAILSVAFTFAVVMTLIADLDRPREGFLEVSQHALEDVQQMMSKPAP